MPARAAEPGTGGVSPLSRRLAAAALGFLVCCGFAAAQTPTRRPPGNAAFSSRKKTGLGWGHRRGLSQGGLQAGLCPVWSRRELGSRSAGAGVTPRPAAWVLSPEESRVLGVLGSASAQAACAASQLRAPRCAPGCQGEGSPPSPHRAPLLPGTFTHHLSLFSLRSCLGSRLAHRDLARGAWQGGLVPSKPWLVCGRARWLTSAVRTSPLG